MDVRRLKKLASNNFLIHPKISFKLYQLVKDYTKQTFRYQRRVAALANQYHKDWDRSFSEHCYDLIMETMGMNIWSLKKLPDIKPGVKWARHHITYDKSIMDSYYLALVLEVENRNQIPHRHMLGHFKTSIGKVVTDKLLEYYEKVFFFERKENLKNLISMKKIWTVQEIKKYLPRDMKLVDINDLVLRLNYYTRHGESKFFQKFFPNFYQLYQRKTFWNSHYLNYI